MPSYSLASVCRNAARGRTKFSLAVDDAPQGELVMLVRSGEWWLSIFLRLKAHDSEGWNEDRIEWATRA